MVPGTERLDRHVGAGTCRDRGLETAPARGGDGLERGGAATAEHPPGGDIGSAVPTYVHGHLATVTRGRHRGRRRRRPVPVETIGPVGEVVVDEPAVEHELPLRVVLAEVRLLPPADE